MKKEKQKVKPRQKGSSTLPKPEKKAHSFLKLRKYFEVSHGKGTSLVELVAKARKARWSLENIIGALPSNATFNEHASLFMQLKVDPSKYGKMFILDKKFTLPQIMLMSDACDIPHETVIRHLLYLKNVGEVAKCAMEIWSATVMIRAFSQLRLTHEELATFARALLDKGWHIDAVVDALDRITPNRKLPVSRLDARLESEGIYIYDRNRIKEHFSGRG
jgi:hypothetical protein